MPLPLPCCRPRRFARVHHSGTGAKACPTLLNWKWAMQKTSNAVELNAIAKRMRREIVEMITHAKSGHAGGSLSAVEVQVTLFCEVMRHDPQDPKWPER